MPTAGKTASRLVPFMVVALVVAALGLVAVALRPGSAEEPTVTGRTPTFTPNATDETAAGGEGGHGGHGPEVAPVGLPRAQQETVNREVGQARAAAAGLGSLADAEAAGFERSGGDAGRNDTHLGRWDRMDDRLVLGEPEMMLAESDDPGAPIIAVVYFVVTPSASEPDGFTGPNDHWHEHRVVCVVDGRGVAEGGDTDAAACAAQGGVLGPGDGWMLHVWAVPGFENPAGTFVAENARHPLS